MNTTWPLIAAMLIVGYFSDWSTVRLVDTYWAYSAFVLGCCIVVLWRGIMPAQFRSWHLTYFFSFTVAWPIIRAYGGVL